MVWIRDLRWWENVSVSGESGFRFGLQKQAWDAKFKSGFSLGWRRVWHWVTQLTRGWQLRIVRVLFLEAPGHLRKASQMPKHDNRAQCRFTVERLSHGWFSTTNSSCCSSPVKQYHQPATTASEPTCRQGYRCRSSLQEGYNRRTRYAKSAWFLSSWILTGISERSRWVSWWSSFCGIFHLSTQLVTGPSRRGCVQQSRFSSSSRLIWTYFQQLLPLHGFMLLWNSCWTQSTNVLTDLQPFQPKLRDWAP